VGSNNKFLSIKGTVLDREQLQTYMEKSAMNAEITSISSNSTYPIPRLNDNFKFIEKTYNLLNEHIKENIDIYPAGEWLLDNFYIIEETVKKISREMTLSKYKNFPGIASGPYKGYSRIYLLASEIVAYTENKINDEVLTLAVLAYQRKKTLSMEEIWSLWLFLEIALIENIRAVCEKIYLSHIQKYKVESIVERLIEKKENTNQQFKPIKDEYKNQMSYKEIKYPFIEYMSYKLKKYGKQGIAYLNILEEQVNKMGITVSDAIKKEHFDIAIQKVLIGNSITSIREINRINFLNLFEEINGVEELLKQDPANVYDKMDYKTKEYYRNNIKVLSKKTKLSEIYIAKKTLELSNRADKPREKHIGYYLIDKGKNKLLEVLEGKAKYRSQMPYMLYVYLLPLVLSLLFGMLSYQVSGLWIAILTSILVYIPITEICIQILNYCLGKVVKPTLIPKLDFNGDIPAEYSTIVVIPTILSNADKVKELAHNLEVYYLANKTKNLYFAILGDCTSSSNKNEEIDESIIKIGIEEIKKLNEKYKTIEDGIPKFYFLYRERSWNSSEKSYLGWERKRGLLCEFNEFLITGKDKFRVNTIKTEGTRENISIKYVITLDADTKLVLDTAKALVGSMAHILNKPVIDENKNVVIDGHALIQPRVGIDLEASRKSLFTKIYAGMGGTDSYTNAISDIYQDNFGEGIFTGKGIYDLNTFYKVLNDEFPENTVLSHDLLEGSYLRCGLASDILLMDGYPARYNSYIQRLHRWIRGDFQIMQWLKGTIKIKNGTTRKNPLSKLSKFKIFDNLRRSVVPVSVIALLIFGMAIGLSYRSLGTTILLLSIISYLIPTILDVLNYIIFKEDIKPNFISAYRNITKTIGGIKASILRGILGLLFLPNQAYIALNAICKTIYRIKISKQNLLEWMTAEEAEKQAKSSLLSYYKNMQANIWVGAFMLIIGIIFTSIFSIVLSVFWMLAPIVAWHISKEQKSKEYKLEKKQKEYILEIGQKTWRFFEENINKLNNYLPPDNYQEDRKEQIAHRTSPTNIGLGMLAICSAYDLKYIDLNKCIDLLYKSLNTIDKLPKWSGHLYNWYNTLNLEPLFPRYVSTVDSGNFIGYLYTLKQFLVEEKEKIEDENKGISIETMLQMIDTLISNTNFSVLFDYKKRLFSIGFNIEENKLTDSYYDLLASEARQASLIAIAKRDIPAKHWNSLSRTLTSLNRYKGLISWSGTAFEYLMPNVNVKRYEGSLLDESCRFMIMSQKEYGSKLGIPWGISEAAFNLKDLNNNYQYKAFGVPWLGLKRGLEEDMVVSPYSIFLSMPYSINSAIENLKRLEKEDMYDKYGFYESIDYTISRLKYGETSKPVKTYMAHHQGLILLSINNIINNDVLVKRFSNNPEIESIDILLQERMPEKAIITKEKKEKVEKQKIKEYGNYTERIYTEIDKNLKRSNVISNGNYTICTELTGEGFSKYKNILINRYKETADYKQGNFFYIKNLSTKKMWCNYPENKCRTIFAPDSTTFSRVDGNIITKTKIIVAPESPVEIRRLELKNNGTEAEVLEINNYFEPVLSTPMQDYSHMAFNNLFLTFEKLENNSILVKRKKRESNQKDMYLGVDLYTEAETIGDMEFEIDKEKFLGKGNLNLPDMIENSKPYSRSLSLVSEPILAIKKTIKIPPQEKVYLDLLICVGETKKEAQNLLDEYRNSSLVTKTFELNRAKTEAEIIYLGLKGRDIEIYQKILSYLIFQNPLKKIVNEDVKEDLYMQSDLWKYGISGDLPILLVKIKDANDMHIIYDVLKAQEYFRSKNIKIDLVILNQETNSYEHFIKYEIENAIQNRQLGYMKNKFGGIFILNENEIEEKDLNLLLIRANLIFDAGFGKLEAQLKDLESEYKSKIKNIGYDGKLKYIESKDKQTLDLKYEDLKYYNEYGGFSEDGLEYKLKIDKENKLPTVWSMILANEHFGTLVTQNLGGFTWNENSRLKRLTAWNNNPNMDVPSEIIYFKDKNNGETWTLSENLEKANQEYHITYGFGYVTLKTIKDEIFHEVETFVAKEDKAKISILKLKNTSSEKKNIKILYYIKPVMGEDETKTTGYIKAYKENNIIIARNLYNCELPSDILYISSNQEVKSYTGSKNSFIGNGNLNNPNSLNKVSLDNESGLRRNVLCCYANRSRDRTF